MMKGAEFLSPMKSDSVWSKHEQCHQNLRSPRTLKEEPTRPGRSNISLSTLYELRTYDDAAETTWKQKTSRTVTFADIRLPCAAINLKSYEYSLITFIVTVLSVYCNLNGWKYLRELSLSVIREKYGVVCASHAWFHFCREHEQK